MPLPVVPLLFLGSSAAAAAKGLYDSITAGMTMTELRTTAATRRATYEAHLAAVRADEELTTPKHTMLIQLRLNALVTVGAAAQFLQRARVRPRALETAVVVDTADLARWEARSTQAAVVLGGITRSVGAGAAAASAVYGAVGLLGAASTGTAIASLSGAAASSATMAWLGGGALAAGGGGMALGTVVLGGLVAGPALLVGASCSQRRSRRSAPPWPSSWLRSTSRRPTWAATPRCSPGSGRGSASCARRRPKPSRPCGRPSPKDRSTARMMRFWSISWPKA